MKIQDFVAPLVASFKNMPLPPNEEGIEAQLAAFIPLMRQTGCREAAAMLQQFVGTLDGHANVDRLRVEDAGIFSPDMQQFRNLLRGYHREPFKQAETLSIKAWAELRARLGDGSEAARLDAIVFLCKCVQACQAVLLLAEHGLELEAAAVLREASEYLFVGCGIARAPELRDRLIRETQREHQKQATMLLKEEQTTPTISPEDLVKLQALAEGDIKGAGMKVFEAAEKASMSGMYHGIYRTMTRIGTHASAGTLIHAIVGPNQLHVGPSYKHLELILHWVVDCLTLALAHGRQWRTNEELNEAIARGDSQIMIWSRLCDLQQEVAGQRALLIGDNAARVLGAIDAWLPSVNSLLTGPTEGDRKPIAHPDIHTVVTAGNTVHAMLEQLLATLDPAGSTDTTSHAAAEDPRREVTDPAIAVSKLLRRHAALLSYLRTMAAGADAATD